MESVYKKLEEYSQSGVYPFHMPGHKRNPELESMLSPYAVDITEIDQFDNLHNAEGILKAAMERAAVLYHSEHTYFSVNGSTAGILAGISGCTRKGDKIIMARNCHKSVYNAVFLNELYPVYIYPEYLQQFGICGGISPEKMEELLIKHPDAKLVVITSPTYEGMISDVEQISHIVHKYNIPLLVDEAHGAHFGFSSDFPENAVQKGADVVIHSTHKTLSSLTQTGLIHVNGTLAARKEIEAYLKIYQSSSPSYVLMASIDKAMELLETQGNRLFESYSKNLKAFKKNTKQLACFRILEEKDIPWKLDPSKIVIFVKEEAMTGCELCDILRNEYKLELEMAAANYALAMTGIGDTGEGLTRLAEALTELSLRLKKKNNINRKKYRQIENRHLQMAFKAADVYYKDSEKVQLKNSPGRISKEYAYLYPPGIPLIVPGEIITEEFIGQLLEYRDGGLDIKGLESETLEYILAVKE